MLQAAESCAEVYALRHRATRALYRRFMPARELGRVASRALRLHCLDDGDPLTMAQANRHAADPLNETVSRGRSVSVRLR